MASTVLAPDSAPKAYTLSDLLGGVRRMLRQTFSGNYWITGEVSEISRSKVGHTYITLVEVQDGRQVAQLRANIWASNAAEIDREFERATGSRIDKGMRLMLLVQIDFSTLYGLSVTVLAVNAEYTLGGLELIKKQTVELLQKHGLWDLNRALTLPLLPLRLAVISSEGAAGWGDFMQQIRQSKVGRLLQIELFPSLMQGEHTTRSVLAALDKIAVESDRFDALLVLRGGGSRLDLSAFDDYSLCEALVQAPLPLLTGIGHERDESVVDLIAHTRLKTPTALAEFVIRRVEGGLQRLLESEDRLTQLLTARLDEMQRSQLHHRSRIQTQLHALIVEQSCRLNQLSHQAQGCLHRVRQQQERSIVAHTSRANRLISSVLEQERSRLRHDYNRLERSTSALLLSHTYTLERRALKLTNYLNNLLTREVRDLTAIERLARTYDPHTIMQRGFVPILNSAGQVITSIEDITAGEKIEMLLIDGRATAMVEGLHPDNSQK